jgi:hypothetical protein
VANGLFGSWVNAQGFFTQTDSDSINVSVVTSNQIFANSVSTNNIISNTQTVSNLTGNNLFVNNFSANNGNIVTFQSNSITANNGNIVTFTTNSISVGNSTVNATVNSTMLSVNSITANNGNIVALEANTILVGNSTVNATVNSTAFALNGVPIRSAGLVLLISGEVTNQANLQVDLSPYSAYRAVKFIFTRGLPATDAVDFSSRISSDGVNFDAGAADYTWIENFRTDTPTDSLGSDNTASTMHFGGNFGNGAINRFNADLTIGSRTEGTIHMFGTLTRKSATGDFVITDFLGARHGTVDFVAIRFFFSSGNIAFLEWALYGYV